MGASVFDCARHRPKGDFGRISRLFVQSIRKWKQWKGKEFILLASIVCAYFGILGVVG